MNSCACQTIGALSASASAKERRIRDEIAVLACTEVQRRGQLVAVEGHDARRGAVAQHEPSERVRLDGGEGDDRLHGHFGNDTIFGQAGADRIFGYGDDDWLHGGAGDDLICGKFGDDEII